MAAPIAIPLTRTLQKNLLLLRICVAPTLSCRSLFWRKKENTDREQELNDVRKVKSYDGPTVSDRIQSLTKKTSVRTCKPYNPPADLESHLAGVVEEVCGEQIADWTQLRLEDRKLKFKVLTRLMQDFNHTIPNLDLDCMETMSDVLQYFSTPVRDTSTYEDLSKLDLPKNLHIQMDPLRFDPETDTMFGGRTAFPRTQSKVYSLRYKAKYGSEER